MNQDLRNHGESPHDPVHNYTSMAEDVEQFMKVHDLKLPVVIGHSMLVYRNYPYLWLCD